MAPLPHLQELDLNTRHIQVEEESICPWQSSYDAIVMSDFTGANSRQLSLRKNDNVLIRVGQPIDEALRIETAGRIADIRPVDNAPWFCGEVEGRRTGCFPESHVRVMGPGSLYQKLLRLWIIKRK